MAQTKVIHINFFGLLFFLITLAAGYFSYKLWPIYTTRNELEVLVKDMAYKVRRNEPDKVKEAIIKRAKKELAVDLYEPDITVRKYDTFVQVDVVWKPVIPLLAGKRLAGLYPLNSV